ncbi:hypothetical protein BGY98DRAFT_979521 [Russula aff. rugulosa BPL654]|nr:hypothetical protein BGY98DRAFT_979521 [Russula aff. rugulosa BPL654]
MVLCTDSSKKLSGSPPASPRKLGLLAGVFKDGSMSVLASTTDSTTPIYEAAFCTLDWGNSELIAAGLSNGTQFHYFRRALRSPSERK